MKYDVVQLDEHADFHNGILIETNLYIVSLYIVSRSPTVRLIYKTWCCSSLKKKKKIKKKKEIAAT